MELTSGFLVYAALFRIAVIAAGALAIYLGYRLFLAAGRHSGTDAAAKGAGFELTLKNAAPGTVFAFFGAFVIAVMLVQGNPELVIEDVGALQERTAKADAVAGALRAPPGLARIALKGGDGGRPVLFSDLLAEGNEKQRQGDDEAAAAAYLDALSVPQATLLQASAAFNELAWLYQAHGDGDAALPLARIAVSVSPLNAEFQHTLATVLAKRGQGAEAVSAMHIAAGLDPQFTKDLRNLEEAFESHSGKAP
jgi:tetratricopeptide (TPR) repeat protein